MKHYYRMMKDKLPLVLILSIVGILIFQKIQTKRKIEALTSMTPQNVTAFKIYPRITKPIGDSIEFNTPDPIIDEFFLSISDLHSYSPSHDTVASQEYSYFLEITEKTVTIQIHFYIPTRKANIVVGHLGKFSPKGTIDYGYFQSRKLFDWYEKYKDRWLTPAVPPGAGQRHGFRQGYGCDVSSASHSRNMALRAGRLVWLSSASNS